MSFNPTGAVEVSLSVFGSLVTEMSPSDLPEGVSPDNGDVAFLPGSVSTRPGLRKVFSTPFPAGGPSGLVPTVPYAKSYVMPSGGVKNLYLDSNGTLWVEDFTNAPGVYSELFTSTPGSYAKSVTAFGREYIAISDGLHGQEVPLQYDGTNLDRVTQDGPGAPPNISNLVLPALSMAVTGAPPTLTVAECDPGNQTSYGYYTAINIFTGSDVSQLSVGQYVTVAGNSQSAMNGTFGPVTAIYPGTSSLIVVTAFLPSGVTYGLGGTLTVTGGATATRNNNIVSISTNGAHNLQPGYQVQITNLPASPVGGGASSIVIDNESLPGLATVTTISAHGLVPGTSITLTGVDGVHVGGSVSNLTRNGGITTAITSLPHGLSAGASVSLFGATDASFDTTVLVAEVISDTSFTFPQTDADAGASGGTVTLNWPLAATTQNYFEVVAAPSANTFQIAVNYSNGAWTNGTITYDWNGKFYVASVPSSTAFTYQQYGPNATTSTSGTVTPYGQASPGKHQMQVMFLTRQGAITRPSPPVKFTANGGQYLSISNIPIGPGNVVSRILAFTGAEGSYFFYIPVPAQVNGQLVSTATQINDNTTTSVILDFSDNTLYSSIGISTPGNNLANQIVLDGALGFGYYGSRLLAYGLRNRVQNLLNMSFDGGYLPSAPSVPSGWTPADSRGAIVAGHFGSGWQITVNSGGAACGQLSQSFAEDAYGAPIAAANTPYKIRCWLKPTAAAAGLVFTVALSSASTGFLSTAIVQGTAMNTSGAWCEATFSEETPSTIPIDLTLTLYASSSATNVTLLVDELSIIYAETPYLDTVLHGSYVNNPEGFDGVSGKFGPSEDTRKVMDFGVIRGTLYLLTQDPSGRLHDVSNSAVTEPAGWAVNQIGANCGALSAFCTTKSQADDASAGGGEEWLAWASASGARIFGGDQPWKFSQEIQPDWDCINPLVQQTIWALNDPVARVLYFGLPLGGTNMSPNLIYAMSYRELDTPYEIATSPPVHTSFSGKLVATDNTRKWTRWHLSMSGAALMYRTAGQLSAVFFAGTGATPGTTGGFGNVYTLSAAKLSDDDYGKINAYYTTYFFVNPEAEAALQLGAHRKMLAYLSADISGVGGVTITPLVNRLTNPWTLVCTRTLSESPNFDLEWQGASVTGQRIAFQVACSPITGTDNSFSMARLTAALKPASRLPIRGAAS